jgi:uncharacterized protein (TIGR00255 family)
MIQSMTGYGKASGTYNDKKIVAEIKSLNSKQSDISTRMAGLYREKEIEVRNLIAQELERGKIDFSLYFESFGKDTNNRINQLMVESYHEQIQSIANNTGITMPENSLEIILRMPDVMKSEIVELDENEWIEVSKIITEAIQQLKVFRQQEGKSLEQVFRSKISNISNLLKEVEQYEAERIERIRARFIEGLQNLSDKFDYDENRLEQELIFYIEKLDVNEEKVRLQTHLDYFLETMDKEQAPGKKLGFITQEIGREINTLGSKSNHSEMQKIVVLMKDDLEQIKEQVLNVL